MENELRSFFNPKSKSPSKDGKYDTSTFHGLSFCPIFPNFPSPTLAGLSHLTPQAGNQNDFQPHYYFWRTTNENHIEILTPWRNHHSATRQKWKKTFSVKDFSQLRSQACLLQNCKTFPNNRRKHKRELTSQLILAAQ